MCGILLCFGDTAAPAEAREALRRRGPDHFGSALVKRNGIRLAENRECEEGDVLATLYASVLHMQGRIKQPLVDLVGRVAFAFNGELYGVESESDTEHVFGLLSTENDIAQGIVHTLDKTEGEWALLLVMDTRVFWCRDSFGRRSLLEGRDAEGKLRFISSVAFTVDPAITWIEIPVDTVFEYDLISGQFTTHDRPLIWRAAACQHVPDHGQDLSIRLFEAMREAVGRRASAGSLGGRNLGVLFSGGIDSVLLAGFAHLTLPAEARIVLVNVSFHCENSPDRLAAVAALNELRNLFPSRDFEFVRKDVTLDDVKAEAATLQQLILPKLTVMDFNIASVLYFASQTGGSCRALLSGLGADELFGGYKRHRHANKREAEMQLDLDRLWTRNLGRDDRVVASNQAELRLPFLDLGIVHIALEASAQGSNDAQERPVGEEGPRFTDKPLVRKVAWMLGLKETAQREKRAAQFGSRMSKLIRPELKGTDVFDPTTAFVELVD
jgi:asparagine synthetase B (glutamine-hydrolysing)